MHYQISIDALDQVPQHLLQSSRQLCERALVAFTDGDWSAFYLNAGFSLEHALKAALAAVHPTLIADPRHFDSMHMLARGQLNLPQVAPSLRTAAYQDVVDNAAKVVPSLTALKKELKALASHRNAVAHIGSTTSSTTDDDVKIFLAAVLAVVMYLQVDVSEFFGDFEGLMSAQLDARAADVRREVEALLATAKFRRDQQYAEGFPIEDYGSVIHAREWAHGDEFQPYQCPVCEIDAVMQGELFVDVDVDWDRDGTIAGATSYVDFTPRTFSCRACGLVLAARHLAAADMAASWVLDDVDPETVDGGMPIDPQEFYDHVDHGLDYEEEADPF